MRQMGIIQARQGFTLRARMKSFGYAMQGLVFMLRTQHNAWLHLLATALVGGAAALCGVSLNEWRWLLVAMAMVWVAETMNTAVECLCDVVSPQYSLAVKRAKDIAAGGVLMAAVGAAAIGLITFWPYMVGHHAGARLLSVHCSVLPAAAPAAPRLARVAAIGPAHRSP